MAEALLKFETIDAEEVDMIMKGKNLPDLTSYRKEMSDKLKEERQLAKQNKKRNPLIL